MEPSLETKLQQPTCNKAIPTRPQKPAFKPSPGHFPFRTFPHVIKYDPDGDLSVSPDNSPLMDLTRMTIPHSQSSDVFHIFTNFQRHLTVILYPSFVISCDIIKILDISMLVKVASTFSMQTSKTPFCHA